MDQILCAIRFPHPLLVCSMYACMYSHHLQQSIDQPGKVANLACGQLDRENDISLNISLSLFAPENLVSRESFGRPVPRQPAYSPHSGRIWC